MKKIGLLVILIILVFLFGIQLNKLLLLMTPVKVEDSLPDEKKTNAKILQDTKTQKDTKKKDNFEVFKDSVYYDSYDTYSEALAIAEKLEKASIKQKNKSTLLWDNYPPYAVYYTSNNDYLDFNSFKEAVAFGKAQEKAIIFYRKDGSVIWSNTERINKSAKIENVGLILQKPELPKGCEVTSLAMLLNYKGIKVDKMELADKIKKDETPKTYKGGKIYGGNPNTGFVGNMKNASIFGFGVYHKPIFELLQAYMPYSALDLTGCDFDDLLTFIHNGAPVWVIINTNYAKLPASNFETWHTTEGEIKITYKEHSVLITGYDDQFIYFNDPLNNLSKTDRKDFIAAWEQMGRQAVSYSQ